MLGYQGGLIINACVQQLSKTEKVGFEICVALCCCIRGRAYERVTASQGKAGWRFCRWIETGSWYPTVWVMYSM